MTYKVVLSAFLFIAIIVVGIYVQIPKEDSFNVLVIDQRGVEPEVATKVAQIMLNKYLINDVYWIFSNSDTTYFQAARSLNKKEECKVIMVNSLGAGVQMAYEKLFATYTRQKKVLFYMPSAPPTSWDEQTINQLPHNGVIIYELDFQGNEKRVPGT